MGELEEREVREFPSLKMFVWWRWRWISQCTGLEGMGELGEFLMFKVWVRRGEICTTQQYWCLTTSTMMFPWEIAWTVDVMEQRYVLMKNTDFFSISCGNSWVKTVIFVWGFRWSTSQLAAVGAHNEMHHDALFYQYNFKQRPKSP